MPQDIIGHRQRLRAIARRAMHERGFLPEFSAAATAQAEQLIRPASDGDPALRDLRQLPWCSIDNEDSRDLDQLSVSESFPDETVKILVAVADVDALVAQGSAIDRHARQNTTSVYTPAQIFPMLPEKLSTDFTSLNEDTDRLAVVVEMVIDFEGRLVASDVYRAQVHNQAKLAYNSVAAWLDGMQPAPPRIVAVPGLAEQLRLQDRVAQRLKQLRHESGALSVETLEARPVFSDDVLTHLAVEQRNRAKALIEDFMIAANGVTARYLAGKGFPSFRRILRAPARWERIVALATAVGERLPAAPDSTALEAFLSRRHQVDPPHFPDLSLAVVKLMGSGEYAVELPGEQSTGHFGLAVKDYTHSTAPNRRFPDLITQRLLKAALAGRNMPYSIEELEELARHCTEQEDDANKIERQVRKSAAALLLETRSGQRFDAIVTGASEKGTWVRVLEPPVEGKVVQGFAGFDVGDRVRVKLINVNVEQGFIDFVGVS
ncbi:MAG: RNB domain-containing ribonuclease [Deltaproteobacteria bacterium]|nr:RNB domain-containing ribonuclease [Deltaproteobacteria bacterium]